MSRAHTNEKYSSLKPGPLCVDSKDGKASISDSAGGGTKNKQYAQTGKKYTGPNYPASPEKSGIVYTKDI